MVRESFFEEVAYKPKRQDRKRRKEENSRQKGSILKGEVERWLAPMGQVPVYDQSVSHYVIMMLWVMVLEISAKIFVDEII